MQGEGHIRVSLLDSIGIGSTVAYDYQGEFKLGKRHGKGTYINLGSGSGEGDKYVFFSVDKTYTTSRCHYRICLVSES